MGAKSTKGWVIQQCEHMRRHVLVRGLATEEEVKDVWLPKRAPLTDWIKTYGWLRAWVYSEYIDSGSREEAEEVIARTLAERPAYVTTTDGHRLAVHPKSFMALIWFREHDYVLGYLNNRLGVLKDLMASGQMPADIKDPVSLIERIADAGIELLGKMVAVALYPGPGMPDEIEPQDLSPIDLYFVHAKFVEVNTGRLTLLDRLVSTTPGKTRKRGSNSGLSFNVFYGTMGQKLKTSAMDLMKNRSMAALIAEARLAVPDMEEELGGD